MNGVCQSLTRFRSWKNEGSGRLRFILRVCVLDHIVFELRFWYRGMDMHMLALFNTCERDADEWERIFKRVDPRFQLVNVTTPPGPSLSIIEFLWPG